MYNTQIYPIFRTVQINLPTKWLLRTAYSCANKQEEVQYFTYGQQDGHCDVLAAAVVVAHHIHVGVEREHYAGLQIA